MERLNKIDADFDDVMRDIILEGNVKTANWSIQHVESTVKILLSVFYGLDVLYKNDPIEEKKELQNKRSH
ncbi:TetR family transcriptional regulator C-terminal domain-containing protein [Bacillus sp. SL00103]